MYRHTYIHNNVSRAIPFYTNFFKSIRITIINLVSLIQTKILNFPIKKVFIKTYKVDILVFHS